MIAGLGAALAVGLVAPAVAAPAPAKPAVLPLWIDPQLLGSAAPAPSAAPPRFTVTRIGANGARITEAIDADGLKALSRPAAPAPARAAPQKVAEAATAPKPVPPPAPPRAPARPSAAEIAALQSAARRGAAEPTWTALAKRSLTAEPLASLHAPEVKKPDGKAALGVRDGRSYRDTGRLYMYAAMKNKGVGMNVVDRGESWTGDGLTYDQGGFAGQRSAGVGWRQGEVSTSLGWVHEKTRVNGLYGAPAEKDDRLALTFSWRPKVPEAPAASK